jgi:hypothetical protein
VQTQTGSHRNAAGLQPTHAGAQFSAQRSAATHEKAQDWTCPRAFLSRAPRHGTHRHSAATCRADSYIPLTGTLQASYYYTSTVRMQHGPSRVCYTCCTCRQATRHAQAGNRAGGQAGGHAGRQGGPAGVGGAGLDVVDGPDPRRRHRARHRHRGTCPYNAGVTHGPANRRDGLCGTSRPRTAVEAGTQSRARRQERMAGHIIPAWCALPSQGHTAPVPRHTAHVCLPCTHATRRRRPVCSSLTRHGRAWCLWGAPADPADPAGIPQGIFLDKIGPGMARHGAARRGTYTAESPLLACRKGNGVPLQSSRTEPSAAGETHGWEGWWGGDSEWGKGGEREGGREEAYRVVQLQSSPAQFNRLRISPYALPKPRGGFSHRTPKPFCPRPGLLCPRIPLHRPPRPNSLHGAEPVAACCCLRIVRRVQGASGAGGLEPRARVPLHLLPLRTKRGRSFGRGQCGRSQSSQCGSTRGGGEGVEARGGRRGE